MSAAFHQAITNPQTVAGCQQIQNANILFLQLWQAVCFALLLRYELSRGDSLKMNGPATVAAAAFHKHRPCIFIHLPGGGGDRRTFLARLSRLFSFPHWTDLTLCAVHPHCRRKNIYSKGESRCVFFGTSAPREMSARDEIRENWLYKGASDRRSFSPLLSSASKYTHLSN